MDLSNQNKPSIAKSKQAYRRGQSHHSFAQRPPSRSWGLRLIIYPLLCLGLYHYGYPLLSSYNTSTTRQIADLQRNNQSPVVINRQAAVQPTVSLIAGGIKLQADRSGQFRGKVYINDVAMPFMIDTGATQIAVPSAMAADAHLRLGTPIQISTAGGQVFGHVTRIDSLKLGNAELKNIAAITNDHLDEVLIGMNALSYFQMTQSGKTLTLVANTNPEQIAEIERSLPLTAAPQSEPNTLADDDNKPKTSWKRTTNCDANGSNCRATYRH